MYIHQLPQWPKFIWDENTLLTLLGKVRHLQGRLLGKMEGIGFDLRNEASLQTLTDDVLKSSEIEGEILNPDQVRSSIARRLGMDVAGLIPSDRNVDGVVEMILDATQRYGNELSEDRLFGWHSALFPTGRSGMYKIVVGNWRNNDKNDPMQVVSGAMGKEKVHYQAPDSDRLSAEMTTFLEWFNAFNDIDPVLKAGIAHLWFVTIHPFDDGNGRIARAITDMQLARADASTKRFYSMSAQIRLERSKYYEILESTQKETIDITAWLYWFLDCFGRALSATDQTLAKVLFKARFWEYLNKATLNDRQKLMLNKLLDDFEGKLNSSKWAKIAKCSQDTAGRDIQALLDQHILIKEEAGGRSTSYILNQQLGENE
ncbi:Fic family protein [Pedobacter sp. AW31-3R]|uniref:Fic family protein n=1 Tax=Pedobacter sp. AW31-3R TaxID=3445781 RepID=UPI003FA13418